MRNTLSLFAILILLLAALYFLNAAEFMSPVKNHLRNHSVSSGLLNYGTMGKVLKQLGVVKAIPNDPEKYNSILAPKAKTGIVEE